MILLGRHAKPGDLIELVAGTFYLNRQTTARKPPRAEGQHKKDDDDGTSGTSCEWPRFSSNGTIENLHGAPGQFITFCGDPETTIIDGSTFRNGSGGAGITLISSSYIRLAGFTFQNALRGMDLQNVSHSEFLHITTSHTYHEGVRLRYWSSHNLLQWSRIKYTGRGYVGNGEGIYIGTASGQTTKCGNSPDESSYNVIRDNIFGPGVTSENVDIKEYTEGGKIINNKFDGKSMMGIHASISWVVLKGNNYVIDGNVGDGLAVEGGGIRVVSRGPGQGSHNTLRNNVCNGLIKESYCIFIQNTTTGNTLGCGNEQNYIYNSSPDCGLINPFGLLVLERCGQLNQSVTLNDPTISPDSSQFNETVSV